MGQSGGGVLVDGTEDDGSRKTKYLEENLEENLDD